MRLRVESDGGLSAMRARVGRVARGEHRLPVAEAVADVVDDLLEEQFDDGHRPDGRRWARKADGTQSYLTDTRAMREGRRVEPDEDGVTMTVPADYAGYHQRGTGRMPQRQILPENELPQEWRNPIEESGEEVLRRILTGDV